MGDCGIQDCFGRGIVAVWLHGVWLTEWKDATNHSLEPGVALWKGMMPQCYGAALKCQKNVY